MTSSSADFDFLDSGSFTNCTKIPAPYIPSGCSLGVNRLDQGWRTSPLVYTRRLASIIAKEVQQMFSSGLPETYICSPEVVSLCGNEVKRFGMALSGYAASRRPLIPLDVLINGIMDKDFAAVLKKTRVATLTRKVKAESNIDDGLDSYVLPNFHLLEDIGQVFNYKYWLRWEEPDPEAWKFGLIPIEDPSESFIEGFEESLRKILPKSISPVSKEEILASISGSATRTSTGKTTKVFREKTISASNYMSSSYLKGHRSLVYKGPTEVRDCLILPIAQSNTIKWIERQMAVIASKTRYSAYGKGSEEFERILEKFYDEEAFYYNRDLTKEGITKPRWFLRSIGKVCKELYPSFEIWDYFSIYEKYELTVDGVAHALPRGTGLGMANALTTIMQCGMFQLIKDCEPELPEVDALFYNDDATIKSNDSTDVLTYSGIEENYFEAAGLILKEAKTYSSPVMILCERYFPKTFNTKDSYCKYVHRIPFAATNIVMAKTQFTLCDDPSFGSLEPTLLPLCLSFWGHEWDQQEYILPSFMGGWLSPKYKGVRLDFLDEIPLNQLSFRGLAVGPPKLKPDNFFKEKGTFIHPVVTLSKVPLDKLDSTIWELYDFVVPFSRITAKFHRSLNDEDMHAFLRHELVRRYLIWSKPAKPVSLGDIYVKVINDNPTVDFLPPEQLRVEVPLDKICKGTKREYPPQQPNKLMAVISFFSGGTYIDKVIPYPYLPGQRNTPWNLTEERISKYRESIYALPGVSQLCDPTRDYELSAVLMERNYCNDYDVWAAWKAVTDKDTYPRPLRLSQGGRIMNRNSLYLRQAEYYGSQEHWDMWTTIGRTIPVIHMSGVLSEQDWMDILQIDEDDVVDKLHSLDKEEDTKEDMTTSDFGTYYAGHREGYTPTPYLREIFTTVRELIDRANLWKSAYNMSDMRLTGERPSEVMTTGMPVKGSPVDILYRKLTKVSGVDFAGAYIYQLDFPDIWGGSEGSEDGVMGLFDDPGG
jgi:hypothetical protein